MRARLLLGWLVGAVLVVGCETNQPPQQEQQSITLEFRATSARVQEMWLWRVFEDSDLNGVPDDSTGDGLPDEYLWCDPQAGYVSSRMPWSFSVQVDVIPGGQTEAVTIARDTDLNASFASYDTSSGGQPPLNKQPLVVSTRTGYCRDNANVLCNPDVQPGVGDPTTICEILGTGVCVAAGVCSGDSSVTCDPDSSQDACQPSGLGSCINVPVTRVFAFEPVATGISGANESTLSALVNIAYVTDPTAAATRGPTGGRCPGRYPGPANVDNNPLPWTFTINRGDTVNVQARRLLQPPVGFTLLPSGASPPIDPVIVYFDKVADPISVTFLVDGSPVGVTGPTTTTLNDPESFIDFFFTSR